MTDEPIIVDWRDGAHANGNILFLCKSRLYLWSSLAPPLCILSALPCSFFSCAEVVHSLALSPNWIYNVRWTGEPDLLTSWFWSSQVWRTKSVQLLSNSLKRSGLAIYRYLRNEPSLHRTLWDGHKGNSFSCIFEVRALKLNREFQTSMNAQIIKVNTPEWVRSPYLLELPFKLINLILCFLVNSHWNLFFILGNFGVVDWGVGLECSFG